ncbi:hypothetical protein DMB92_02830 [Campylobacter sp. MIT 99-7217]|uniref:DUF2920 family protein n=1 Tax=Campylobacter sp. MIT 99-7217 TaxID=535091 RepID=UPI001156E7A3|nr:DUF2920 family protein [Campylobacter sp. MIT 99-7217]TQR33833.1 hypothetical protein DMB92_02830 [Campylobacter sp. MIT 99-7217]
MLIRKKLKFKSSHDLELNIKREEDPDFVMHYDDEKTPKAFVFVLQGWGSSADDKFLNLYLEYFAKKYELVMVSVNYHCIYNRFDLGSHFMLDERDKSILEKECEKIDIKLSKELLNQKIEKAKVYELVQALNYKLSELKKASFLKGDFRLKLHASIVPKRKEYQNFGLMAALDILNAALFVKKLFNARGGGGSPLILAGESYGAYLSMLCAKLAPWLVDGLIENSGGVEILPWHVGLGKELDFTKYPELAPIENETYENLSIYTSTKSLWNLDEKSKFYFSPARKAIRTLLNKEHLKTMAGLARPLYVSYHCKFDPVASFEAKKEFINELLALGFEVDFKSIVSENQVDGKFIKNLNHGMDTPLKMLIEKELFPLLQRLENRKKPNCEKNISYLCDDLLYNFFEEEDQLKLKIKGL